MRLVSGVTSVVGNFIGTNATGAALPNNDGVLVRSTTSVLTITDNVIAFNDRDGVVVEGANHPVTIQRNSIFGNQGQGIDLADDGPTDNDGGDNDSGVNGLLNYPVLTAVTSVASGHTIDFDLDTRSGQYTVSFFENPSGLDPDGIGEGEIFLSEWTFFHSGGVQSYNSPVVPSSGLHLSLIHI